MKWLVYEVVGRFISGDGYIFSSLGLVALIVLGMASGYAGLAFCVVATLVLSVVLVYLFANQCCEVDVVVSFYSAIVFGVYALVMWATYLIQTGTLGNWLVALGNLLK